MKLISKEELANLKSTYPVGSRVELVSMGEDPRPIPSGSLGTVKCVDDAGTIHVAWDSGRILGVVYGVDEIRLV